VADREDRILRSLYVDTFKTSRARHEVTERELLAEERAQIVESVADGPDPFQQVERAQLMTWIGEEIAALDEDHREVLTLCVMRELAYEEVAALDVPVVPYQLPIAE
jgi:DNA-directed RNA polymerase specialized sigma24 family protein